LFCTTPLIVERSESTVEESAPASLRIFRIESVVWGYWPTSPTIATSASRAGKSANTA
jgi:hypothetical protein